MLERDDIRWWIIKKQSFHWNALQVTHGTVTTLILFISYFTIAFSNLAFSIPLRRYKPNKGEEFEYL